MVISALTNTEEQEAAERKEVRITTTATAVVKQAAPKASGFNPFHAGKTSSKETLQRLVKNR